MDRAHPVNKKEKEILLVVDDEEDILDILEYKLSKFGFAVIPISSGDKAIKYIIENHNDIDLVLSDIKMPGEFDGIKLLSEVRNNLKLNLPVILMTGYSEIASEEIIEKGAAGFIKKPFEENELLKMIKNVLRIK